MTSIPIKSTGATDWEGPLKSYLKTKYGESANQASHVKDIFRLHNARQIAVISITADEESINNLKSYFKLLVGAAKRFPSLSGTSGSIDWGRLRFSWQDTFTLSTSMTESQDIEFEKANVMFNIAAFESQVAAGAMTIRNFKKAKTSYAFAASCFECLENGINSPNDAHNGAVLLAGKLQYDLSPDALVLFKNLMLGLAGVCLLQQFIQEKTPPEIAQDLDERRGEINDIKLKYYQTLAKVSSSCAEFFNESFLTCKSLSSVVKKQYEKFLEFLKKKYEAIAYYYTGRKRKLEGKLYNPDDHYGFAVGYLERAAKTMKEVMELAKSKKIQQLASYEISSLQSINTEIAEAFKQFRQDNDKIYRVSVPVNSSQYPFVEPYQGIKGTFDDDLFEPPADFFSNLYLPWVKSAEEKFHGLVRGKVFEYRQLTKNKISELRELFNDLEKNSNSISSIPDSLWKKIESQVLALGGVDKLELEGTMNQRKNIEYSQLLESLQEQLNTERDLDEVTRAKYGVVVYSLPPVANAAQQLCKELFRFRSLLLQSRKSDEVVIEKFKANSRYLDLLRKPREELSEFIPNHHDPTTPAYLLNAKVQTMIARLEKKMTEIQEAVMNFEEEGKYLTIVPDLQQEAEPSQRQVAGCLKRGSDRLKLKTDEIDSKLSTLQAEFSLLLDKTAELNKSRTDLNEACRKKKAYLEELDLAVLKFKELQQMVHDGLRFYTDWKSQIEQLRTNIIDFCVTRNTQRLRILSSISEQRQQQLSGFPSPPPFPPPSPSL